MRLIDADALRQYWLNDGENEYVYDTNAVLDSIDVQITIEAEPVRHGKWGEYEIHPLAPSLNGYPCSVCGQHEQRTTNYCPTCGARMDLED